MHSFPSFICLAIPASNKPKSSPTGQKASSEAEDCATVPLILVHPQKISQIGNTDIEEKEVEVQDSNASYFVSDLDPSYQVLDTDLCFESDDPKEEGLLIQNLHQLDQELLKLDQEFPEQDKSLCQ